MLPTTLDRVAAQAGGTMYGEAEAGAESAAEVSVLGVTSDSRKVTPGDLFVAIAGERVDGNTLATQALCAGAVAVMSQDPQAAVAAGAAPARVIAVADVYQALGRLAHAQLEQLRALPESKLKVVAVTGSVGKTTTKDLLREVLSARGPIIAPPGSFNNELGMPLTVLRANADTATLVLEMGTGNPGDLAYLTDIAEPDVAIELIVARAHLGFLGGIDAVAAEKQVLVERTREDGAVILNGDDPRVAAMSAAARGPVTYFSTRGHNLENGREAGVYATDISVDSGGHPHFTLHTPEGTAPVALALVGEHNVHNALACAGAAHALGIPIAQVAQVLSDSGPGSAHRMAVHELGCITLIDDSYNANPDSMRAGISAAMHIGAGRPVIALLGEMAELGDHSLAEHRALGKYLGQSGLQALVAVASDESDVMEQLAQAAQESGVKRVQLTTSDDAERFLQSFLAPGAVVFIKGSHCSGVWQIAESLVAAFGPGEAREEQKGAKE